MTGTLKPLFGWRSSIAASDLRPPVRHVALTLSLHMNEAGDSAFPSLVTLARETGLAKSTVSTAIKALEAGGFLRVRTGGGRARPNHYRATMPKRFASDTVEAETAPLTSGDPGEQTAETTVSERVVLSAGNGSPRPEKGSSTRSGGRTPEDVLEDVQPAAAPRPRDVLWDVLVQIYGPPVHDAEHDRRNRCVKLLRQAEANPSEILELRDMALGAGGWVKALQQTAIALATNIGELRRVKDGAGSVQDQIARRLEEAAS